MQKITPFLWFDHQAEEAMNFYVSIFRNSKVLTVNRYGEAGPGPKGFHAITPCLAVKNAGVVIEFYRRD